MRALARRLVRNRIGFAGFLLCPFGLGTQPPTPSLGLMLSESRDFMILSPWTSLFSGLAILLASLGFNLFGDGLRDVVDPALRGVDG